MAALHVFDVTDPYQHNAFYDLEVDDELAKLPYITFSYHNPFYQYQSFEHRENLEIRNILTNEPSDLSTRVFAAPVGPGLSSPNYSITLDLMNGVYGVINTGPAGANRTIPGNVEDDEDDEDDTDVENEYDAALTLSSVGLSAAGLSLSSAGPSLSSATSSSFAAGLGHFSTGLSSSAAASSAAGFSAVPPLAVASLPVAGLFAAPNTTGVGQAQVAPQGQGAGQPAGRNRNRPQPLVPAVATRTPGRQGVVYYTTAPRNHQNPGLEAPGLSCTDPSCQCGHTPWPTSGNLNIRKCAMVCEVCGMFRHDFWIGAGNLRRHVRQQHELPARTPNDPPVRPGRSEQNPNGTWKPAQLYDSVLRG